MQPDISTHSNTRVWKGVTLISIFFLLFSFNAAAADLDVKIDEMKANMDATFDSKFNSDLNSGASSGSNQPSGDAVQEDSDEESVDRFVRLRQEIDQMKEDMDVRFDGSSDDTDETSDNSNDETTNNQDDEPSSAPDESNSDSDSDDSSDSNTDSGASFDEPVDHWGAGSDDSTDDSDTDDSSNTDSDNSNSDSFDEDNGASDGEDDNADSGSDDSSDVSDSWDDSNTGSSDTDSSDSGSSDSGSDTISDGQDDSTDYSDAQSMEARTELILSDLINQERQQRGLAPLNFDQELRETARYKSSDMATRNYFDHTAPDGDGFLDIYRDHGYNCRISSGGSYYLGGENIAQTWFDRNVRADHGGIVHYDTAEELANGLRRQWMTSDGHRRAILRPYYENHGLGVEITSSGKVYATEHFC